MLTLWNPFVPVKKSEYRTAMSSFFDNMFQSMGIDQIKNEDGSFTIDVDLPGIKESDICIQLLEDNIITIKGERKTTTSSYSINKSFSLPENSDPETLKAELKDGVLSLTLAAKSLPQTKEPKKIPITTK